MCLLKGLWINLLYTSSHPVQNYGSVSDCFTCLVESDIISIIPLINCAGKSYIVVGYFKIASNLHRFKHGQNIN